MNATTGVGADEDLTLTAPLAVSADGGSITRVVHNVSLIPARGAQNAQTHTLTDAVMVKPALKETVKMRSNPYPTATAAQEYMSFGVVSGTNPPDPVLNAVLGSLMLGVETYASRPPASDTDLSALTDIAPADADAPFDNSLMVSGDTSFVGMIGFLADAATCTESPTLTDIRKPVTPATTPATYTDEFMAQNADGFTTEMHLCVVADGKTMIPDGEYKAQLTYKGLENAAFPPMGADNVIGKIMRDGTTVHIPFLATHDKFHQRLFLRNRSSQNVTYNITFMPEEGVTATAGEMASDMIKAGELKVLSVHEIVTLEGKNRTAATVTAPVAPGMFDVSTALTNRSTGSTSTETHSSR